MMSSVQVLVCGSPAAAGSVGVKLNDSVCDAPRLSKYSTVTGSMLPLAPNCVSVAGRLALRSIVEVGCTATDERLIWIGTSPTALSRGCGAMLPLVSAGQPISTSAEGVRR